MPGHADLISMALRPVCSRALVCDSRVALSAARTPRAAPVQAGRQRAFELATGPGTSPQVGRCGSNRSTLAIQLPTSLYLRCINPLLSSKAIVGAQALLPTGRKVQQAPSSAAMHAQAQQAQIRLPGAESPIMQEVQQAPSLAAMHAQAQQAQNRLPGAESPIVQEMDYAPYCEQLAMAGLWQASAAAGNMEASYEGITGLNPGECARELEDRLPRWPDPTVGGLVRCVDYVGTAVFSMTGTLTAAGAGMDILGGCVVGTITAVGGGTIRDFLIARDENGRPKRAFWMDEPEYLYIAVLSSLATYLLWNEYAKAFGLDESDQWIFWLDSLGIGGFCVIGAMHGIRANLPWMVCAICGMFTATFGGVTRDVLSHRPVRILHSHSEMYAMTALSGASAYVGVRALGGSYAARVVAGMGTAVGLRYLAWTRDIRLPALDHVHSTQATKQQDAQALASQARRPGHSSGVEAMHKREMARLAAFLHYGAVPTAASDLVPNAGRKDK